MQELTKIGKETKDNMNLPREEPDPALSNLEVGTEFFTSWRSESIQSHAHTYSSENHFQTRYRTLSISIYWFLRVQFKQTVPIYFRIFLSSINKVYLIKTTAQENYLTDPSQEANRNNNKLQLWTN